VCNNCYRILMNNDFLNRKNGRIHAVDENFSNILFQQCWVKCRQRRHFVVVMLDLDMRIVSPARTWALNTVGKLQE